MIAKLNKLGRKQQELIYGMWINKQFRVRRFTDSSDNTDEIILCCEGDDMYDYSRQFLSSLLKRNILIEESNIDMTTTVNIITYKLNPLIHPEF